MTLRLICRHLVTADGYRPYCKNYDGPYYHMSVDPATVCGVCADYWPKSQTPPSDGENLKEVKA